MSISLKESQAVSDLAGHLYDFLPGNPHPYADSDISFPGAAGAAGVRDFWRGGSKRPAISQLLSLTLDRRRDRFCPLIQAIVRRALPYRSNKVEPVVREEIERLNELVAEVGFKIPELWDPMFLDSLPSMSSRPVPSGGGSEAGPRAADHEAVRRRFNALHDLEPQPRGYAFEKFLTDLFALWELRPRRAFRNPGEQIDGSFVLDGDTYLLEARWRNRQADQAALLAFSGKVAGKSEWSRGLFISYAGFTGPGLEAFRRGSATNIVCVDGLDLHLILEGSLDWAEVIRRKARRAAETGDPFVPVRELFPSTG